MSHLSVRPDVQAGNAARAFGIFRTMRDAQLAPDEATYGALLHACGKVGDAARAERLFAEMREAGVPQGVLTYTPLMHANVTCNTPESLARVFQARPALIQPHAPVTSALMRAAACRMAWSVQCLKHGKLAWHHSTMPVVQLLDEMERAGVAPSVVTYGCLLSACERICQVPEQGGKAVQRAFELYRQVRRHSE